MNCDNDNIFIFTFIRRMKSTAKSENKQRNKQTYTNKYTQES